MESIIGLTALMLWMQGIDGLKTIHEGVYMKGIWQFNKLRNLKVRKTLKCIMLQKSIIQVRILTCSSSKINMLD